jgi:hypothetical protein
MELGLIGLMDGLGAVESRAPEACTLIDRRRSSLYGIVDGEAVSG